MSNYIRLSLMIGTSVILMFGITYLESFQIIDHAYFSETRVFVALLMGATMVVVMMLYMLGMYPSKAANISIFFGAVLVFAGLLYLLRSQITVDDVDYMEAMIPHHSIAILTSERAQITDPRVRKLADEIIKKFGHRRAELLGARLQLLERFLQAVGPHHFGATQGALESHVVVARYTQGCAMGDHRHDKVHHFRRLRATVAQVTEEDRPAPSWRRRPIVSHTVT